MGKVRTFMVGVDCDLPIEGYLSLGKYDHISTYALKRIPVERRSGAVNRVKKIFTNKEWATTEAVWRSLLYANRYNR